MIPPKEWWHRDYSHRPHINVQYELVFEGRIISSGTEVKFKNDRNLYLFKCLVHDTKQDITWIDAFNRKTGDVHSFHVSRLKCISLPKRSRKKKIG